MTTFRKSFNNQFLIYLILALFTLTVYITGLFPETTVDSAKYASVSREIFENGDFVHLKIHGEPYDQKPPLLFWLGAISFKLFGLSIFAFKLPNLIYSFLGIYSTYRLGQLIYDKRTGLIASLLYATSEALFLYNMDVHTDILLTTNIIFSVWQLAEYIEKQRRVNFILGFVGIGLSMISKGVIGLVVPVLSIGGYLLIKKDFRKIFSLKWLAGLPILLVILYPTLKGLRNQFGNDGIIFYFWSNVADRIQGEYSKGGPDYLFFFHTLAYIFLPWSFFAFIAFVKDFRIWRRNRYVVKNFKSAYCYSVIVVLAIVICVSSQQSPHYLLPAIPFISIITAKLINDISFSGLFPKTYKLMLIFRNLIIILLWPVAIIMTIWFFPTYSLMIWIPIVFMFILLLYSFLKLKTKVQKLIIPLMITMLIIGFVSNTVYMPSALKYHGPIQASFLYNRIAADTSELYTYDYFQFETYFYPKNVSLKANQDDLEDILSKESCWFITSEKGFNEIKAIGNANIGEHYIFPYKKLTNISLKFLNPETRESTLQKIYLLKIQ